MSPLIYGVNGVDPTIDPAARLAASAVVAGAVTIGAQANLWYNVVLRAESASITIGARTNLQDGVIGHADPGIPLEVGDDVGVGHGAVLHGCRIGAGSLIGMRATVINGAVVPEGCMVAAGSLVLPGLKAETGWMIMGSPAKAVRPLTEAEVALVAANAPTYVGLSEAHDLTRGADLG
ncbi:gamma carbonic anhydrase family protein [Kribbia dieselivorans]|uniref:gamma carbonic anhydrase family protein n=1 Tax=Kribbia dieselivorans TaxID=331526 RepID=UPI0008380D2A|nr:gamma carbonic anhydrase family protein [Kribbia dieselivorans]